MNEEERKKLGEGIKLRRLEKYGTVTAAIRAAGVNSETWNRAERGDTVRPDRMAAITKALWDTVYTADVETVTPPPQDEDTFMFRRPDGLSDEAWRQIRRNEKEHIEWQIEKAFREGRTS